MPPSWRPNSGRRGMPSVSGRSTDSSTPSDYSLQSNRKTIEGKGHPDRDAQFQYINRRVKAFQRQGQPVVSVDAKKKELVGQFRNGGREWQPEGQPEEVEVYDFAKKDLGKVIPYGVYDQTTDTGWVSVGVDHDTAEFAVETLRRWWRNMGSQVYPRSEAVADHGRRGRLQREPMPVVEGGVAGVGRRDRAADLGVPLPAGDEQVEQDRAPDVLPHHGELAGPPAGEPGGGGEPDRSHDDEDRVGDPIGVGRGQLPDGSRGQRRADGGPVHQAGQVPRRVELHHSSRGSRNGQFIVARLLMVLPRPLIPDQARIEAWRVGRQVLDIVFRVVPSESRSRGVIGRLASRGTG